VSRKEYAVTVFIEILFFLIPWFLFKRFRIGNNPDYVFNVIAHAYLFVIGFIRILSFTELIKDFKIAIKFVKNDLDNKKELIFSLPGLLQFPIFIYIAYSIEYDKKMVGLWSTIIFIIAVFIVVQAILIVRRINQDR